MNRPASQLQHLRILVLSALALMGSGPALAVDQPSTYPGCATRSITVPWGGSAVVDLKDCHSFGLGVVSMPPRHGTATPGAQAPVDGYRYTHGAATPAGGGGDRFVVLDDNSDTITVTVSIQAPASTSAITIAPSSLPALRAGETARIGLVAGGGRAPYSYRLASGELPAGLALATDGVLSGVPTVRAPYAFEVAVRDAGGATAKRSYAGTVLPGTISVSPTGADVPRGLPFRLVLVARGGLAPHRFRLEGGQRLPEGLRLSPDGVISGTTTVSPGPFPLTLRVTDASGGDGEYFEIKPFVLRVVAPPAPSGAGAP